MLPSAWCQSKMIMVPKKDPESTNAADYRPVSLFSHGRKLLEHCLVKELDKCTLNPGIIAYKRKMGCEVALALLDSMIKREGDL